MSKYLLFLFLFFSCLFSWLPWFQFFFSFSARLFLFFFWGPCVDSCVSSFFFSSFLGAPHFFLIVFGVELFSCFFFFFGGLVFSPSLLPSPEQAAWNRSYFLSSFSDRVDILVNPVVTMPWTTCPALAPNILMYHSHDTNMRNGHIMFIYIHRT